MFAQYCAPAPFAGLLKVTHRCSNVSRLRLHDRLARIGDSKDLDIEAKLL